MRDSSGYKPQSSAWLQDIRQARAYSCANATKVTDEGLRVLATKGTPEKKPMLMRTRKAKVRRPLLCVADLVDNNKTVIFDTTGSFAVDKRTGDKQMFERKGKGWDLTLDLQAPDAANEEFSKLRALAAVEKETVEQPQISILIGAHAEAECVGADGPFGCPGYRRL